MKSFVLRGDFVSAPEPDRLESVREGYMVVENGVIRGLYPVLPEQYRGIPVEDYSGKLILQEVKCNSHFICIRLDFNSVQHESHIIE